MKPPSPEDITRQLQQAHFPQKHGRDTTPVPVGDTPLVVSLEQLRPYELNPRVVRNPLYDEIKASIREGGMECMKSGYCDENWAIQHHNLWYDEIKANGSLKYKD